MSDTAVNRQTLLESKNIFQRSLRYEISHFTNTELDKSELGEIRQNPFAAEFGTSCGATRGIRDSASNGGGLVLFVSASNGA
jgi:hypothetical protein